MNDRVLQMQLRSDHQVQSILEEALLSCVHLCSISIVSIKIDDLSGFITAILDCNTQLSSLELINCTEQLILNERFFQQNQDQLIGLENLNLS
jgi:hypothetical protein